MRNVEEANHILYGCIVMSSNLILTSKTRKPLRVSIVKRLEWSYCRKYRQLLRQISDTKSHSRHFYPCKKCRQFTLIAVNKCKLWPHKALLY